jgi:hypothetical protein
MKSLSDINEITNFAFMTKFFELSKNYSSNKTLNMFDNDEDNVKFAENMPFTHVIAPDSKELNSVKISNLILANSYPIETLFLNQKELSSLMSYVKIEKVPVSKKGKLLFDEKKEIVFPSYYDAETIALRNDPNQIGFKNIDIKLNSDTGAYYQYTLDLNLTMNHPDVLNNREDLLNLINMSQNKKTKKLDCILFTFGWNDVPPGMLTPALEAFDKKTTSLVLNMKTYSLNIEETGKCTLNISFIGTSESSFSDKTKSNGLMINESIKDKTKELYDSIRQNDEKFFDAPNEEKEQISKKIEADKKRLSEIIFDNFKDKVSIYNFISTINFPKKQGYTYVEDKVETKFYYDFLGQNSIKIRNSTDKYYSTLFNSDFNKSKGELTPSEEAIVSSMMTQINSSGDGSETYYSYGAKVSHIIDYFYHNYNENSKDYSAPHILYGTFDIAKRNGKEIEYQTLSIADFILPWNLVLDWFYNLIKANGINTYTLGINDILDSFFNDLVFNSLKSYNDLKQKYLPKAAHNFDIYITYDNKFFQRTMTAINELEKGSRILSSEIRKHDYDAYDPDKDYYDVLFISGNGRFFGNGDVEENLKNNVYHFYVSADTGFLKKVNFTPIPNPQRVTSQIYSVLNDNEEIRSLKGISRFDCTLNLIGNSYFKPGQVIYIDTSLIGFGDASEEGSVAFRNNIGGYYIITRVEHSITPHYFDTTINCVYHDSGKKN